MLRGSHSVYGDLHPLLRGSHSVYGDFHPLLRSCPSIANCILSKALDAHMSPGLFWVTGLKVFLSEGLSLRAALGVFLTNTEDGTPNDGEVPSLQAGTARRRGISLGQSCYYCQKKNWHCLILYYCLSQARYLVPICIVKKDLSEAV